VIKRTTKMSQKSAIILSVLGLIELGLIIKLLLHGKDVALFHPQGYIAQQQFELIIFVVSAMLVLAIPTLTTFYFVAWKYRETNTKAKYEPNFQQSTPVQLLLWGIPLAFMIFLATAMWSATHRLQPQKTIAATAKPLTIHVGPRSQALTHKPGCCRVRQAAASQRKRPGRLFRQCGLKSLH
jgi:hypothetical protein